MTSASSRTPWADLITWPAVGTIVALVTALQYGWAEGLVVLGLTLPLAWFDEGMVRSTFTLQDDALHIRRDGLMQSRESTIPYDVIASAGIIAAPLGRSGSIVIRVRGDEFVRRYRMCGAEVFGRALVARLPLQSNNLARSIVSNK